MPFVINSKGHDMEFIVNAPTGMWDRKAADLLMGSGGAYCDVCTHSKEDCLDVELIKAGIPINRTVQSCNDIFERLQDDDGCIFRQKGDYSERQGQTSKPILKEEILSVQVLHSLLRCFDHFMKIVTYVKAGVYNWAAFNRHDKEYIKVAKLNLQDKIKEMGLKWDIPDSAGKGGTTTTGNVARCFLLIPNARNYVLNDPDIPMSMQVILKEYGKRLAVILRVISSKKKIDVDFFKQYCTATYLFLIESFPDKANGRNNPNVQPRPWISITSTVHKVLAHGWELIEKNNDCGLGSLDESGLESNNKILRRIRTRLSRKTSQSDNLEDTLTRLWLGSDPLVHDQRLRARPYCKHCEERGHSTRFCPTKNFRSTNMTNDDELVQSFMNFTS